jgi:hypothetical protein
MGRVEAINIGPPETLPAPVDRASARAGKGLVGNRYYFDGGAKPGQALTLIAAEALEAMAAEHGVEITGAATCSRAESISTLLSANASASAPWSAEASSCASRARTSRASRSGA